MIAQVIARPASTDVQRLTLRFGAPIVGLAATLTSQIGGPTLCPLRLCTDHACPGCGLTRGVGAAVRGDLALAWRFHPLAVLIAVQVTVLWAVMAFGSLPDRWQRRLPIVVATNALLLIGVWLVRWKLGLLDFVVAS